MDEGVPREDGGPARAGRRPHQPAQVADLVVAVGEASAGLGDHAGREVDAGRVGARLDEVRRDVSWTAPGLDDGAAVGVRGDPVEQPTLERLAEQLVGQVVGVAGRDGVVGRSHPLVARLAHRRRAPLRGPLPARPPDGDLGHRDVAEQVYPADVVLPALPGQLAHQRLWSRGQVGEYQLDLAAVRERRGAARCGSSARRAPARHGAGAR